MACFCEGGEVRLNQPVTLCPSCSDRLERAEHAARLERQRRYRVPYNKRLSTAWRRRISNVVLEEWDCDAVALGCDALPKQRKLDEGMKRWATDDKGTLEGHS
jgi:hypothetical protein